MDLKLLKLDLLFSIIGFCTPFSYNDRQFHFIDSPMTWKDAQRYCREKYTDLVTIENEADHIKIQDPNYFAAWIGLHDDPDSWKTSLGKDTNSWRWSNTGETNENGFHSWLPGQPDNRWSKEYCVQAILNGTWDDRNCRGTGHFACYSAPNPQSKKTYFVSTEKMTWEAAQTYCRTHYTDLALIENAEENKELSTLKGSTNVWIGLYRNPWRWSDNRNSSYMSRAQLNNYGNQHCVGMTRLDRWEDFGCSARVPFWCQEVPLEKKIILKMKIRTGADLSDLATNTQLLHQFNAALSNQTGQGDLNLKWTIQPEKEEEHNRQESVPCKGMAK